MSMRPRSSWLRLGLGIALLGGSMPASPVSATEAPASIPVEVAPIGPEGLGGLALLEPTEAGSSVQLLVVGAPAGTTAVVHVGGCATIDPTPVGLLGDLADGQLQAALSLPLEAIADGAHVIVLHPGLDLTTALGCGPIPALAGPAPGSAPPLPLASVAPLVGAEASMSAIPAGPGPECDGVAAWAQATDARLDELQALADEASRLASVFDLPGYVGAIDAYARAVEAAAVEQMSPPVPALAQEANDRALAAYATMLEAATLFLRYYTVEMSPNVFGQASITYQRAMDMAGEIRRDTARLSAICEGP